MHHKEAVGALQEMVDHLTEKSVSEYDRGRTEALGECAGLRAEAERVPGLEEELVKLRKALEEQLARAASADATEMVDRRVIRKLMVTYFQRPKAASDILNLIASMLVC